MPYVLAVIALAMPVALIVGTIRGRVRPTCCANPDWVPPTDA
jgi:hypothetical protein